jgi:hypothetical protein
METLSQTNIWLLLFVIVWVMPWKIYATWTASKLNHKIWFVVLFIFNTFAILEILYVFFIAKKTPKGILRSVRNLFKKAEKSIESKE